MCRTAGQVQHLDFITNVLHILGVLFTPFISNTTYMYVDFCFSKYFHQEVNLCMAQKPYFVTQNLHILFLYFFLQTRRYPPIIWVLTSLNFQLSVYMSISLPPPPKELNFLDSSLHTLEKTPIAILSLTFINPWEIPLQFMLLHSLIVELAINFYSCFPLFWIHKWSSTSHYLSLWIALLQPLFWIFRVVKGIDAS